MFKVPTKEITDKRRQGKIRQANALIRSKQPLDLMQKRLFYLILETVRTTDTQLNFVEFPVPVLRDLLSGTYGSFQSDLFTAAQGLVSTSFSILNPSGSWVTTPIFDRIEYLKVGETNNRGYKNNTSQDVVRARLHDDLEMYLLKLERNYNTQDLIYVLTIPRVRSHRLYEILLHESWRGERPEFEMQVEELQSFLGIDETYKRWQDFKRTLTRQRTIVHKFTDLRFDFEGRRAGRAVTHVHFHVSFVKKGVQGTLDVQDPHRTIEEIQLANELKDVGYTQDPYMVIREHGVKIVRTVLKQAKAAQKASRGTKSEIRNLGGFIHYRLQNPEMPETSENDKPVLEGNELDRVVQTLMKTFEEERNEAVEKALADLSDGVRHDLTASVYEMMNAFERDLIDDTNTPAYRAIRNRYLLEHALIELPHELKSPQIFYAEKDFGYEAHINETLYTKLSS